MHGYSSWSGSKYRGKSSRKWCPVFGQRRELDSTCGCLRIRFSVLRLAYSIAMAFLESMDILNAREVI